MRYFAILYFIVCMIAGAASDSLAHMNYTELAVWLDLLEKLMLISGAVIFKIDYRKIVPYILVALMIYVVGFDYIYNWIHELPWDYHGSVKAWDLFLAKIPTHGLVFIRVILLTFGVSLSIRYL